MGLKKEGQYSKIHLVCYFFLRGGGGRWGGVDANMHFYYYGCSLIVFVIVIN